MCGTINPGSYIRLILDFDIKTGYDMILSCFNDQHVLQIGFHD
jgi:hypothetical protein